MASRKELLAIGHVCPKCGSTSITAYYTAPATYQCSKCKSRLEDENDVGIPILTRAEAEAKRPGLYGLPYCDTCGHKPHPGTCKEICAFCQPDPPHIYKFRVASSTDETL